MLIDKQLKHLFKDLIDHQNVEILLNGSSISLKITEDQSNLHVTTPVYFGGNYIPKSVRNCLSRKAPFDEQRIPTYLTVDEEKFQIFLNFLGKLHDFPSDRLIPVLHEFSWLADEWKAYLDQHDKNDLVHVRVK